MKDKRVRYAFKFGLHLSVIVMCAGCQSFRWGERSSDDLEDTAKAREVYSKSTDWISGSKPPYWDQRVPGSPW
jgi:hypothetical protein